MHIIKRSDLFHFPVGDIGGWIEFLPDIEFLSFGHIRCFRHLLQTLKQLATGSPVKAEI